jgi:putative flippase GtrA
MINYMNLRNLFQSEKFYEFVRFGIVGVMCTLLHYGIYWILKHQINYNIAFTIGYAISFIGNFFMTSYFTFKKKVTIKKGFEFGGVHLFNYLFQMFLLNLVIYLGINKSWAPIPVYCIVIPMQFIFVRFVFKRKSTKRVTTDGLSIED